MSLARDPTHILKKFEQGSLEKKHKIAETTQVDQQKLDTIYDWIQEQMLEISGNSYASLAYRSYKRGRQDCALAEHGYIITSPIDVLLSALKAVVKSRMKGEEASEELSLLYHNKKVYQELIHDIIQKAQVETYKDYGPLKKTEQEMVSHVNTVNAGGQLTVFRANNAGRLSIAF